MRQRLPPRGSWQSRQTLTEGVSSREKGVLKSPQAFQNPKISNNSSADYGQSAAEAIPNPLLSPTATAAAMEAAAAHAPEGAAAAKAATAKAAASGTAAKAAAAHAAKTAAARRAGRTPVVVPGRAGPVIAGTGAVSGTKAGTRRRGRVPVTVMGCPPKEDASPEFLLRYNLHPLFHRATK